MPDQPTIQRGIAEILREHQMLECSWGTEPDCCVCGYDAKDKPTKSAVVGWEWLEEGAGWSNHVAEVLVAELGITREQRTLADGMGGVTTNYKTGETTVHSRPCTRQSRYVTEWGPDE